VQPQVLRLRLTPNHPSDEDLSPGAPAARQTPLRMTAFLFSELQTQGTKVQAKRAAVDGLTCCKDAR
jgi:hypothetical protein